MKKGNNAVDPIRVSPTFSKASSPLDLNELYILPENTRLDKRKSANRWAIPKPSWGIFYRRVFSPIISSYFSQTFLFFQVFLVLFPKFVKLNFPDNLASEEFRQLSQNASVSWYTFHKSRECGTQEKKRTLSKERSWTYPRHSLLLKLSIRHLFGVP